MQLLLLWEIPTSIIIDYSFKVYIFKQNRIEHLLNKRLHQSPALDRIHSLILSHSSQSDNENQKGKKEWPSHQTGDSDMPAIQWVRT